MDQPNRIDNLSDLDRSARSAVTAVLVTATLTSPFAPAWLLALAAYPAITAIAGRDPLYALAHQRGRRESPTTSVPTPAPIQLGTQSRRTLE